MEEPSSKQMAGLHDEVDSKKETSIKVKIIRALGTLFILLGIAGLLLPYVNNFLIRKNQLDFDYKYISKEEMKTNLERAVMFPVDQIREIGHFDFWKDLGKADRNKVVGEIHIPYQDIHLPIFSDSANENLLAGVGMMQPEQKMGEGNFLLSGHRPNAKGALLHEAMKIKQGNTIYLTDKDKIYVYSVRETNKYPTDAVFMLEDRQVMKYDNNPILTLMTCYNGKTDARLFVVAELIDVLPYDPVTLNREYVIPYEKYINEKAVEEDINEGKAVDTANND